MTLKPLKVGFRGFQSKNFTSKTPLKIKFSMDLDLFTNFFYSNFFKIYIGQNSPTLTPQKWLKSSFAAKLFFLPLKFHPLTFQIKCSKKNSVVEMFFMIF